MSQVSRVAEGYNSTAVTVPPMQLFSTPRAILLPMNLSNGQTVQVSIPVNRSISSGFIWMRYNSSNVNGTITTSYANIGTFIIGSGG